MLPGIVAAGLCALAASHWLSIQATSSFRNGLEPLPMRVGLVSGSCLAIANKDLRVGSGITVVSLDEKELVIDGRVIKRTAPGAKCPTLVQEQQPSFYELKLPMTVGQGIAVIGATKLRHGGIDLTGDGIPEQFTWCSTSEGFSFEVWAGKPYVGSPLWSGYYYLGFDVEPNCP